MEGEEGTIETPDWTGPGPSHDDHDGNDDGDDERLRRRRRPLSSRVWVVVEVEGELLVGRVVDSTLLCPKRTTAMSGIPTAYWRLKGRERMEHDRGCAVAATAAA